MKKKLLLLMVLAMAFACLFVICASASDRTTISYTDASGVTHSVPVVKYDDATAESVASVLGNNATVQARFVDNSSYAILKATDGTLTAYPTWYIIEPSGSSETYVAISEVEYTYVNSKSGKTYERGATLYVEFPEGMTHLRNNGVWGRGTHYEKNVTEIVIPKSVIVAQDTAFENNTTLKKVHIKAGSAMTTIEDYAFESCTALEYFQFENLTQLTSIDGFANSKKLSGDLDLSKNTQLKTIGNNAFLNTIIAKVTLPDSVESIGSKAFCGSNFYFASPYLPKNLTSVGNEFLSGTKNLNSLLIFPEGVTSIDDEGFSGCYPADSSQTFTVVFLGKMTKVYIDGHTYLNWGAQTNIYFAQNSLSDVKANVYSYTDKATGALGSAIANNTSTGTLDLDIASQSPQSLTQVGDNFIRLYFCEDDGKVVTSHILTNEGDDITEDRGTFVMDGHTHYTPYALTCASAPVCIVCDIAQVTPHTEGELLSIAYPNGYTTLGNKIFNCTVCEGDFTSEGVADAIYVALGYSYKLDGSGAIKGGYRINQSALDAWKTYNGSENDTLVFGVIIFNPTKLTEQNLQFISTETGKATIASGVVQVQVESTYQYTSISFNVAGITTSTYESLELVFAGYALELDKYDTISYAQTSYEQGNEGPVANTYTRDGVTLHSVTASKIDALDGTIEGIANN